MAISAVSLASTGNTTDAVQYNMPSASYDAGALILVHLLISRASAPSTTMNLTGLTGATWELVQNITYNTTASPGISQSVYRTMLQTSQNAATITASFGGSTMTGFAVCIDQVTGCATSGTNGSAAIAQSVVVTGTAAAQFCSIGFASTPSNAVWGGFGKSVQSVFGTPTGFSTLGSGGITAPAKQIASFWRLTPTTTFTSTFTAGANSAAFALEFVPQTTATGGAVPFYFRRLLLGVGR